jgi:hypothetical protein
MMKVLMLNAIPSSPDAQPTSLVAPPVVHGFAYGVALSAMIWAIIAMIIFGIV